MKEEADPPTQFTIKQSNFHESYKAEERSYRCKQNNCKDQRRILKMHILTLDDEDTQDETSTMPSSGEDENTATFVSTTEIQGKSMLRGKTDVHFGINGIVCK